MSSYLYEVLIRGQNEKAIRGAHYVLGDTETGAIGQAVPIKLADGTPDHDQLKDILGEVLVLALATIDERDAQIAAHEAELEAVREENASFATLLGNAAREAEQMAVAFAIEREAWSRTLTAKETEITGLRSTQSQLPMIQSRLGEILKIVERRQP